MENTEQIKYDLHHTKGNILHREKSTDQKNVINQCTFG